MVVNLPLNCGVHDACLDDPRCCYVRWQVVNDSESNQFDRQKFDDLATFPQCETEKTTYATRRCLAEEFGEREWEDNAATPENEAALTLDDVGTSVASWLGNPSWYNPLTHEEGDPNNMQGAGAENNKCTSSGHGLTSGGWWYVRFKDRRRHKITQIRLWNRFQGPHNRLENACVRFSLDGVKPSPEDPTQNCDMYLPEEIKDNTGPGSGTYVTVDKMIVGMMLISQAPDFYLTLCGIEIYEETAGNSPRYPALHAAGCVVQEKAGYHGFDLPGNPEIPRGTSLPECVHRCTQNSECAGILFNQGASRGCMLKMAGASDAGKEVGGFNDAFDAVELRPGSACRTNVGAIATYRGVSALGQDLLLAKPTQEESFVKASCLSGEQAMPVELAHEGRWMYRKTTCYEQTQLEPGGKSQILQQPSMLTTFWDDCAAI
eukprot:g12404.t1